MYQEAEDWLRGYGVERMGRSQVAIADAMNVRRTAVSGMLSKLRRDGLIEEDPFLVDAAFERLNGEEATTDELPREMQQKNIEPRVIILERKRDK